MSESPAVTLRVSGEFRDELDEVAYRLRCSRSELIRAMLVHAAKTMPELAWHGQWPDIRPMGQDYGP